MDQKRIFLVILTLILLTLGVYTSHMNTLLVNSPYFLLGICAFYVFKEGWNWFIGVSILIIFGVLFQYYVWQDLIVSILTFGLVIWLPSSFRVLGFTGKISYSYYLIHGLIGGNFLYFTRDSAWSIDSPYLMIIFALLLSWIGAFLMYFCIEKPSLLISKKIKYKK